MKTDYIIITPAYNEGKHIEEAIKSVITQTILPQKWLILNDGSTDNTNYIIKKYETSYDFITSLRLKRNDIRSYYSRRTQVVLLGYEKIKIHKFDFLGFLDADIILESTYYENILTEFNRNPKLGIASGIYVDKVGKHTQKVIKDPDRISTPGGFQTFKRECYEDIGGYRNLMFGGDDSLANIMARMKGWETMYFPQYRAVHQRPTGTSQGANILNAKWHDGQIDYTLGMHPLFAFVKSFRRIFLERPLLLAAITRLLGFLSGYYLVGNEREIPDEVVSYVRKEQIARLLSWGLGPLYRTH